MVSMPDGTVTAYSTLHVDDADRLCYAATPACMRFCREYETAYLIAEQEELRRRKLRWEENPNAVEK